MDIYSTEMSIITWTRCRSRCARHTPRASSEEVGGWAGAWRLEPRTRGPEASPSPTRALERRVPGATPRNGTAGLELGSLFLPFPPNRPRPSTPPVAALCSVDTVGHDAQASLRTHAPPFDAEERLAPWSPYTKEFGEYVSSFPAVGFSGVLRRRHSGILVCMAVGAVNWRRGGRRTGCSGELEEIGERKEDQCGPHQLSRRHHTEYDTPFHSFSIPLFKNVHLFSSCVSILWILSACMAKALWFPVAHLPSFIPGFSSPIK